MDGPPARLSLRSVDQGVVCSHVNNAGLRVVLQGLCSDCYRTFTPLEGRRRSKPRNGDLDFFEELAMTHFFIEVTPTQQLHQHPERALS